MAQNIVLDTIQIVKVLNIGVTKIDFRLSCANQDHLRQGFIGLNHDKGNN